MRIQIFSDIHNDLKRLEAVARVDADIYISAGDLVTWARGLSDCAKVLKPLGEKLWVLPGNHESADQIAKFCEDNGFRDFHEQVFEAQGWHFAGLGYSNRTPFSTPGEYSEEQLEERLARFTGLSPMVLVCHAPPLNTDLDGINPDQHFGSQVVLDFIQANQPRYFFCGHIHEAAGKETKIGETVGRNVGKRGYLLEL
jgi:hypothetical protein